MNGDSKVFDSCHLLFGYILLFDRYEVSMIGFVIYLYSTKVKHNIC
jgi:hypothetical protein